MTPVSSLGEFARSLFSLAFLSLCVAGIVEMIRAAVRKRFGFFALLPVPFAADYMLWQVLFDIRLFGVGDGASALTRALGSLPWICWLAVLAALALAHVLILIGALRLEKQSVTPAAVKQCLDQMPCGVCCWRDNGMVIFSNVCMNRLCQELTGAPLLDGNSFGAAIPDGIVNALGGVWRVSRRKLSFDGAGLNEMIASDVTAEYARTRALEEDKAALSRLNDELREYDRSIDDTVRRREILQAKVDIHDEMNSLMLSTVAAGEEDRPDIDRILSLWERSALLLCMESDEKKDVKASERIEKLASALDIRLEWRDPLPDSLDKEQRDLFFCAAQEAVANAAKHARAKTLSISFGEESGATVCRFTNDGKVPDGEVKFEGGLLNLALLAKDRGATLAASAGEVFTLTLSFRRKAPETKNQPIG